MNGKTMLKRLEELAQRWPQDTFADDLETKLDNMTDDEIALRLDAYARLVDFLNEGWEDEVELDAEAAELRTNLCRLAGDLTRLRAGIVE